MSTLTAPASQAHPLKSAEEPINLFQLGALFVIRASYWSCRAGNEAEEFSLSPSEVESRAIASFGSKDLVDPEQSRKVFQQLEKRARHQLGRYSRPFPAAAAHFVPWDHVPALIDALQGLKGEFDARGFFGLVAFGRVLPQGGQADDLPRGVAQRRRRAVAALDASVSISDEVGDGRVGVGRVGGGGGQRARGQRALRLLVRRSHPID
jgi:hypothetical protein